MKKMIAAVAIAASLFVGTSFAGTGVAHASTIHTVLPGQMLWTIGAQRNVPFDVIKRANGLTSDQIRVGQFLKIPQPYMVQSGDTLWLISQRFGVSMDSVRYINNKWDTNLNVGQVLFLPTPLWNIVSLSASDLDLFERLVSAESKGEPFEGQAAVAGVVMNRVVSKDFPNTVRDVILQYYGSVPAFSPVANGQIYQPAATSAKEAVRLALLGYDYSLGAQFFYNPAMTDANNWIRTRTVTTAIGHHLFAR
jgi:N-acetylmuramoyl-L-alanine amidase